MANGNCYRKIERSGLIRIEVVAAPAERHGGKLVFQRRDRDHIATGQAKCGGFAANQGKVGAVGTGGIAVRPAERLQILLQPVKDGITKELAPIVVAGRPLVREMLREHEGCDRGLRDLRVGRDETAERRGKAVLGRETDQIASDLFRVLAGVDRLDEGQGARQVQASANAVGQRSRGQVRAGLAA